jgi:hypothetical protein
MEQAEECSDARPDAVRGHGSIALAYVRQRPSLDSQHP